MATLLVYDKRPYYLTVWRYLLEDRDLRYLVTGDETCALVFCREAVPNAILVDGPALTKGGHDHSLSDSLRSAAPEALLIALWPNHDGAPAWDRDCPQADYNVPGNNDFAAMLQLVDSTIARCVHGTLAETGAVAPPWNGISEVSKPSQAGLCADEE